MKNLSLFLVTLLFFMASCGKDQAKNGTTNY